MSYNASHLGLIDTIKDEGDRPHVSGLFESDVYGFTIDQAFIGTSAGGADFMDLKLVTAQGRVFAKKIYFTSGTAKGRKNTYPVKVQGVPTGELKYQPGFVVINDLVNLVTGHGLDKIQTVDKLVKCWDNDAKKEIPMSRPVCVELNGQQVALALQENIIMKQVNKDGVWQDSEETKKENDIVKAFNEAGQTLVEFNANAEPSWIDGWLTKNKGKVTDKTGNKAKVSTDGTGVKKVAAWT